MKELKDIVRAYEEAESAGKQTALATVVHLEGSAYRRPGARMLVTEDGKLTGAISGGCLEGDALRKAQLVMLQKKPMLVKYDTTDDDDAKLGVGLGCNGIITILIEPLNTEDPANPVNLIKKLFYKRQAAALVTLFSMNRKAHQPGTCLLMTNEGELTSTLEDSRLEEMIIEDSKYVLERKASITKIYDKQQLLTGFIELVEPAVSILIFGAGNDSFPLVKMADILGWEITVIDGRTNYATKDRFPLAKTVLVAKPENVLPQVTIDSRTVAVLVTHNYNYDIAMLKQLLPLEVPYIGNLGPKKKLARMLDELREGGINIRQKDLDRVYGPSGLDIGAETSEEIALSIISEIKAVLSNRSGTPLRDREDVIHPRETQEIIETVSS